MSETRTPYEGEMEGLWDCARCGQDHPAVTALPIPGEPVHNAGVRMTHWLTCPETGAPVLLYRSEPTRYHRRARPERVDELVDAILALSKENGYPPTVRALQAELRWSSTSVVAYYLRVAEREGIIAARPFGSARSLVVVR